MSTPLFSSFFLAGREIAAASDFIRQASGAA
jgi:hypothetical protein